MARLTARLIAYATGCRQRRRFSSYASYGAVNGITNIQCISSTGPSCSPAMVKLAPLAASISADGGRGQIDLRARPFSLRSRRIRVGGEDAAILRGDRGNDFAAPAEHRLAVF